MAESEEIEQVLERRHRWEWPPHSEEIEQVLERRHRWEWPPVPEGWRACDNQTFFDDDGSLWRLVTSAPEHESPFEHEREWVQARRIDEQRWVTPWVEVSGNSEEDDRG